MRVIVYKSNLVIYKKKTSTLNEPVIGRWKRTQNEMCLWVRRYGVSLTHLCEIEPVSNRICLEELKKARGFSFHGKGNKGAALILHLDWFVVVKNQTKLPATKIRQVRYMNSFTHERWREPGSVFSLRCPWPTSQGIESRQHLQNSTSQMHQVKSSN